MAMRASLLLACCLLLPCAGPVRAGDLLVVVNAHSGVEHLSRDQVVNLFMGRYREFPSGVVALPIDQPSAEKSRFYRKLVGKELAEINAYWARLYFSGKTSRPKQSAHGSEVVAWVAGHEGALAYIDRGDLDDRMKVVLELP